MNFKFSYYSISFSDCFVSSLSLSLNVSLHLISPNGTHGPYKNVLKDVNTTVLRAQLNVEFILLEHDHPIPHILSFCSILCSYPVLISLSHLLKNWAACCSIIWKWKERLTWKIFRFMKEKYFCIKNLREYPTSLLCCSFGMKPCAVPTYGIYTYII